MDSGSSTSYITLSRKALHNNLSFLRDFIHKDTRISSVVKGNAYGHGIEQIVPLMCEYGVRHFSVFSCNEARRVRACASSDADIMIMGWIDNADLEWAISKDIEIYIFELDRLKQALTVAKKQGKQVRIHIEVETGMNRTGFVSQELPEVIQILEDWKPHYVLEGICTHYAGAESVANYVRVKKQIEVFHTIKTLFLDKGLIPNYLHTACSAATFSYPKTQMDMVRIGIMQYGFWPSRETYIRYRTQFPHIDDPLKRVISWKTRVMSVKQVGVNEFIGYGTSYLTQENTKICTIPVGYAYGYSRSMTNIGRVIIKGKRLAIIGVVNMNLSIVDIKEAPDIKKGDEVILIGEQQGLSISVASFGEYSNQLNYELLTRLPKAIPRYITE
ncbi:MAG: alanine racemase [Bernardetiaceae bacterium]|nr:alanine racemase [Bernardetiaceae bacterium]